MNLFMAMTIAIAQEDYRVQFSTASELSGTSKTNMRGQHCQRCYAMANSGKIMGICVISLNDISKVLAGPRKPPVSEEK